MAKIVIVEDRLGRGVSLARQFKAYAEKESDFKVIESVDICYFCANPDEAKKEMESYKDGQFHITHVNLDNFNEKLDEYLNDEENYALLIIDYLLDDDGSEGENIRRVNIRYARNRNRKETNRLWFYTAAGPVNKQIMGELVGTDHVIDVKKVGNKCLQLDLNNEKFRQMLNMSQGAEV